MSLERIFTAGPMQNIDWKTNGQERAIPHLMADSVNSLLGISQNLQLWNNNTPKTMAEFALSKFQVLKDFTDSSIETKNAFLAQFSYNSDKTSAPEIFTDTDENFATWLQEKIEDLLETSKLYEEVADFHICDDCGNLISESSAPAPKSCGLCGGEISVRRENGIFLNIPQNGDFAPREKQFSKLTKQAEKDLLNRFKLMPPRIFLNKRRKTGISLARTKYDGFVIDPKIAISLLPEFAAEQLSVNEIVQIQGISTATNTIPFTTLLNDGNYQNSYIFINKTPAEILFEKPQVARGFYGYLLGALSSKMHAMNAGEFAQIRKDYLQTKFNLSRIINRISNNDSPNEIPLSDVDMDLISQIRTAAKSGEFAKMNQLAKDFINKRLARTTVDKCQKSNAKLEHKDTQKISQILQPIFDNL